MIVVFFFKVTHLTQYITCLRILAKRFSFKEVFFNSRISIIQGFYHSSVLIGYHFARYVDSYCDRLTGWNLLQTEHFKQYRKWKCWTKINLTDTVNNGYNEFSWSPETHYIRDWVYTYLCPSTAWTADDNVCTASTGWSDHSCMKSGKNVLHNFWRIWN